MSRNHVALERRRWAKVRRQAFERDGYRCCECGRAGRLEAHHEPPLREGADPYDLDGIQTLCSTCHVDRHREDFLSAEQRAWRAYLGELAGDS